MKLTSVWDLVKEACAGWWAHNAPRLGAALAYYTMLSVAPLLVIVTAIGGLAFGRDAARGQLLYEMKDLVGTQGADALQTMLANAYQPTTGILASVLGIVILVLGATGVFVELQDALNTIWGVQNQAPSGVWGFIRTRLLSFLMILVIGFLLLVSLSLSACLAAVGTYFAGPEASAVWQAVNFVVSLGVVTLLFAAIFKWLPDAHIGWRDVWIGAAMTAVLFTIGKLLIGLYLGSSSLGNTYGAAGSLAVFLVWVYYSAQILYFGAEFTRVYATHCGTRCGRPEAENVAARDAFRQPAQAQGAGARH